MAAPERYTTGEYPSRTELRKTLAENPLPSISPDLLQSSSVSGDELTKQALVVIAALNAALVADDVEGLAQCFFPDQSYWKDQVAMTYHMRTFKSARVVAANLLATKKLRGVPEGFKLEGTPLVIPVSPTLQWIDCYTSFRTTWPAASASGRLLLLPHVENGATKWKIWILSTWLDSLDVQAEDESLLQIPSRQLEGLPRLETEVLIIGGGNAGACLAGRLKALAVDSIILERNAHPGDNWAFRYDSLRFHVPTSMCEMPYITYPKEVQTPNRLTRDALAYQLRRFITTFHLNLLTSVKIHSTTYSPSAKLWEVTFTTSPTTPPTIITAKHLVQATGVSSQKPYTPSLPNAPLYKGLSIHSTAYKNPSSLSPTTTSIAIVGAANTAFDILSDLASSPSFPSPPTITMIARSPTYIFPESYVFHSHGFGSYDILPLSVVDRNFNTLPVVIDYLLAAGLFSHFASEEPERYDKLKEVGFPARDSTHPEENIAFNILERAGGHYVDIGGTKVLEEGRATVKNGEPVGWTEKGLRMKDGSEVEVDAVVWCTGFGDKDVREVVEGVLGGEHDGGKNGVEGKGGLLGPREIAERVDATWGVDAEGEIRGMWKRHLRVENYWVMGGHTGQHRWFSSILAMQIKAALEGILPPAYRETVGR